MVASITDKFRKTFNSGNPEVTFVTSTRAALGTTLACDNLAGWPTSADTPVDFVTYRLDTDGETPVPGTQIDWKGIVSGSNITNLTRVAGAADTGSQVNDVVEAMPTGTWANDLITGILVSHDQDGTLKDSIVTTAKINNAAVTDSKISLPWTNSTPTFTGFTLGNGTINKSRYFRVNDLITYELFVTLGSTSVMSGNFSAISLPVTADFVSSANVCGTGNIGDTGTNNYTAVARLESSTTMRILVINTASTYGINAGLHSSAPHSWGSGDTFQATITYPAA